MPTIFTIESMAREEGMIQKAQEYILEILEIRFENLSHELIKNINQVKNIDFWE